MLHTLRIDVRNDVFNRHGINHLLKGIILPVDLVVLLELEDLAPLDVLLNFWTEELGLFDAGAFEVLDPGGEKYFGLGENELEKNVLASPFGGSKMACKCRALVDEVFNGVEGGLSHYCVEWDCFHPSPDHFCDGGHCCRDCCHDRAVLALTTTT